MKKVIQAFLTVILSILFTLVILEVVLNFFPVNEGLRAQKVNKENSIFKFKPGRISQYSKHWNFDITNKVIINNDGFVSSHNYYYNVKTPLLSIIGDSYVEALMVPTEQTVTYLTNFEAQKYGGRVYSFAASGAGLAQHMAWANYAQIKFKPDSFIFVIIANDFEESLASYSSSPGFHRFKKISPSKWEMVLSEYEPSLLRLILRNSKLAMYLITNLKVHSLFNFSLSLGKLDRREVYVGNYNANVDKMFWEESKWATKIYLDNISDWAGVSPKKISFIIDGVRPQLYKNEDMKEITNSFWYKIRKHFIHEAQERGYEVIDMQKYFIQDYKINAKFFEFKTDSHWNSYAHELVSKKIVESNLWKELFIK